MRKNVSGVFIFSIIATLLVGLIFLNNWIQGRVGDIVENPIQEIPIHIIKRAETAKIAPKEKLTGEVLKKTHMAPDRTFEQNIFYQRGEEIARHKVTRQGEIYDEVGVIPDGKVKFLNEANETYGAEMYKDGKRHGPMRVFYKNGQMMQEAFYQFGKIVTSKEYYQDGMVSMEMDLSDAREYDDGRDVGVGKVYFHNGRLKYEWKLTKTDPAGYHRSYNQNGQVSGEIRYDRDGEIVSPKNPSPVGNPLFQTGP